MKPRRLSEHLFLALLIAVSLPLLITLILAERSYREGFFGQFSRNARSTFITARRMFQQDGEGLMRRCRSQATTQETRDILTTADSARAIRMLTGMETGPGGSVMLLDKTGQVIARVPGRYRDQNRLNPGIAFFVERKLAGHDIVPLHGGLLRIAVSPVHIHSEVAGYLAIMQPLNQENLRPIASLTGGLCLIQAGAVQLTSDGSRVSLPAAATEEESVGFLASVEKRGFIFHGGTLGEYAVPLYLAVGQDVTGAELALEKTRWTVGGAALVGLLLALLLSAWLTRKVTGSLEELVSLTDSIATGVLTNAPDPTHSSVVEVESLRDAFLRMHIDLRRSFGVATATNIKLDQRLREISVMNRINTIVAEVQEHEVLLIRILEELVRTFSAERGSIMILTDKRELLVKEAWPREDEKGLSFHRVLRWGEGIAGIAVAEKAVLFTNQGSDDPRYIETRDQEAVRSLMSAPLTADQRSIGAVTIVDKKDGGFTPADRELFAALAHPVSVALSKVMLNELAITDGMTHLYLKRYFEVRLDEEVKRARRYGNPLTLLFCDLDHFKKINDTYGHPCGDDVIREFSDRLRLCVRLETDIAARLGGEEFAVLLPRDGLAAARVLAGRIHQTVRETPFSTRDGEIPVTVSIGISCLPSHALTPEDLLKKADEALYTAKENGRDRVAVWSPGDTSENAPG